MKNQEWMELGEKIQNLVSDAVNSRNYQELNRKLNQTINKAVDQALEKGSKVFQKASDCTQPVRQPYNRQAPVYNRERKIVRYKHVSGEQMKAYMMAVTGGLLVSGTSLGIIAAVIGFLTGHANSLFAAGLTLLLAGDLAGIVLLFAGLKKVGFLNRFGQYKRILADKTYCEFQKFAEHTGKSVKFVKKDIKKMLAKGWFLEGHLDKQETCLIISSETYRQYEELQNRIKEKKEQEELLQESLSEDARNILERGDSYLARLCRCRSQIDQRQMNEKISHMELVVQKIFERAKEHPEVIPDLKKMMEYYLPTTVKLLEAYEELEEQPVQGENIVTARKEIENTLDTLITAFEKLLDSIFQDTAWDISSDISVLNTMLAQEGLTEDELTKQRKGE